MNLTVIGTGYVGLVTGACFAEMGNDVTCVDTNSGRIDDLRRGAIPIHEPGLEAIVQRNVTEGRMKFAHQLSDATADVDVYFIAVGTPSNEDGSADLGYVLSAARDIGRHIQADAVVVGKSTVPVGTGDRVKQVIAAELAQRTLSITVQYVSNPEFLKEGAAIADFMRPDRVVVGGEDPNAILIMRELYAPITRNHERMMVMGVREAEMTKYAANAMLATRISFMNEIADICESVGADVESVRVGIGSDSRIGYSFIYAGCGYGGSCFPKDVKALIHMAGMAHKPSRLLEAVEARNEAQKHVLAQKILAKFGPDLSGRTIGVWGLAFKPGTDDMREAPSLVLIRDVVRAGGKIKAYDPVAATTARGRIPERWFTEGLVQIVSHQYEALEGADAMALVTEWKPFRQPDFRVMKRLMRGTAIFDGRNQYDPMQVRRHGFEYYGIGRAPRH